MENEINISRREYIEQLIAKTKEKIKRGYPTVWIPRGDPHVEALFAMKAERVLSNKFLVNQTPDQAIEEIEKKMSRE